VCDTFVSYSLCCYDLVIVYVAMS